MLNNKFFICFAEDWGKHPTSSQHLMSKFLDSNSVLWVNSISMRSPRINCYDIKRLFVKLKSWKAQPQQKEFNNLEILSPLVIAWYNIKIFRKINENLLSKQISKRLAIGKKDRPILWISVPTAVDMLEKFNEALSIYYCGDEFPEYPGVSRKFISNTEQELLNKVDLVLVASQKLFEAKKKYNENTFIVSHGVNFEHFNRENYLNSQLPSQLKEIKKPIIGFYGLIADWVDIDLFEYIAKNKPEWSLVLIGNSLIELSSLKKYNNIYILGPINYNKLPQYSINFDVALMPFKNNKLTSFVNPLKMFELMASGLPIVSTYLPELDKYKQIIKLAISEEDFLVKIEESLKEKNKGYIQRGIILAKSETWKNKTERVSMLIEETIAKKKSK